MFDLGTAARQLGGLMSGVTDAQLDDATPCEDWTVADLIAHVHQFSSVFTTSARKEPPRPPQELVSDWRTAVPDQLDALVVAWRNPAAWEGRVSAGGIEMAAADNAVVAVEELTIHGWDLAVATGQPYEASTESLDGIDAFFVLFSGDDPDQGPFGPVGAVSPGATRWERSLARTGRDPRWAPPG